jgi:hypothetical protein
MKRYIPNLEEIAEERELPIFDGTLVGLPRVRAFPKEV